MRPVLIAKGLLLLSLSAFPADGAELLPLAPGWIWHLSNFHDRDWRLETAGETVILGRTVRVVKEDQTDFGSGAVLSAESYWSRSVAGDLLFHGYAYPRYGSGEHYEPPILYVDSDLLEPGQTWTVSGRVFLFNEWEQVELDYEFHQQVASYGMIQTPAGAFLAYGFEPVMIFRENGATATGRPASHQPWFSPACGERAARGTQLFVSPDQGPVRRDPGSFPSEHPFLLDWWSQPVPVAATSWGGIKSLY